MFDGCENRLSDIRWPSYFCLFPVVKDDQIKIVHHPICCILLYNYAAWGEEHESYISGGGGGGYRSAYYLNYTKISKDMLKGSNV
jgi:hypothetical protein